MSTLTERSVIHWIKVLATGDIEIAGADQVLRNDVVVGGDDVTQLLQAGQDLSALDLPPNVLAIAAAVWWPDQVQAKAAEMLQAMRDNYASFAAAQAEQAQLLEQANAVNHQAALAAAAQREHELQAAEQAAADRLQAQVAKREDLAKRDIDQAERDNAQLVLLIAQHKQHETDLIAQRERVLAETRELALTYVARDKLTDAPAAVGASNA
jgi:hypothetical protein